MSINADSSSAILEKLNIAGGNLTHGNTTNRILLNNADGSSDEMVKIIMCVFLVGLPLFFCCLYTFVQCLYIAKNSPPTRKQQESVLSERSLRNTVNV